MTHQTTGEPPESEVPAPAKEPAPIAAITVDIAEHKAYGAGLHRRRTEARALRPLRCGCRDPWPCRHYGADQAPVTDQFVDGYRDAALHLLAEGLLPAPNVEALRALWRRGGEDQQLARRIAEDWKESV